MSELYLPLEGPRIEAAQAALGFTPDDLAAMMRDGTFTIVRSNITTDGRILKPHDPETGILVRCLPTHDHQQRADATRWHAGELDLLADQGVGIPTYYVAIDPHATRNIYSNVLDAPGVLYTVVEKVKGPELTLSWGRPDQHPELLRLGRALINFYCDIRRADRLKVVYDLPHLRQYKKSSALGRACLVDLDPFATTNVGSEVGQMERWIKGLEPKETSEQLLEDLEVVKGYFDAYYV